MRNRLRPSVHLLSVRMKTSIGEAFPFVFAKKAAITQYYMVDFVARALAIQPMPFLWRLLSLSAGGQYKEIKCNGTALNRRIL